MRRAIAMRWLVVGLLLGVPACSGQSGGTPRADRTSASSGTSNTAIGGAFGDAGASTAALGGTLGTMGTSTVAGGGSNHDSGLPDQGVGGTGHSNAMPNVGSAGVSSSLPAFPNFVFILGEAIGWTNTSTQQDSRIPASKSATYQTPNLDSVASRGTHFSDFYAPSPRCMPSRASLLTGRSPAQLHMTFIPEGNKDGAVAGAVVPPITVTDLPANVPTIASILAPRGYVSAHFGKWHAGRTDPTAYGFSVSDGPTTNVGPGDLADPNPTEAYGMTERAIAFMGQQVRAGKPFYLQVSHYNARSQTDATAASYAEESVRLAGADADTIGHAAALRDVDITVGQLLQALEQLGIADCTYVIFSSDHGAQGGNGNLPLAQGKGTVWEGGIRVPFFVRGPGIRPGTESHVRATGVDLLPTLAQLAGVSALPAGLEGGSLTDVWFHGGNGAVTRTRSEFVVHYPHYDKDPIGPASAILLGNWKLIRSYEDGSLRLFDLSADYAEKRDLASSSPDQAFQLDQQMATYLTAIGAELPGHL